MKRTSSALHLAALVVAGAGCGDVPPPRAPAARAAQAVPAPMSTLQPASEPLPASTPAVEPTWPHHMALPAAPACVFSGSKFSGSVRLAPDGAPFAFVGTEGRSDVHLPQAAPGAPAVIEARFGPLTLRGVVPTDELELHPARSLTLGGLLWLKPEADLGVVRAGPDLVAVKLRRPLDHLTDVTVPVEADVPCAQLRFEVGTFDPRDALGKALDLSVLAGWKVPSSLAPGGAPVAKLKVPAGEPTVVSVLARDGKQSRIVVDRGGALVVAWVPTASLRPLPDSASGLGLGGRGIERLPVVRSQGTGTFVTCRAALAVGVLQDGVSRRVGTFAPGVQLETGEKLGDVTVVAFEHRGLGLHQGARFVAKTEDLASCSMSVE